MFAKLLKYEFKSCAGLMGILSLGSLGVGAGSGLILRYMVHTAEHMIVNDSLEMVLGILFFFSFLTLFAFAIIGSLYPLVQFYKRKFTDQGYLTFTLPVRSWQIYLTSFLNILFWDIIMVLTLAGGFVLVFAVGFVGTEIWGEIVRSLPIYEFEQITAELDFINPLYYLVSSLGGVMLMINSIVLGSVIARKRKVLGAVGVYYGTTMLMSAVSAWITNMEYVSDPLLAIERMQTATMVSACAFGIGGAILAIWLMDKKLNLP